MKKRYFVFLLAVIMLALCLMSGCSKDFPGPAPSKSATVYKYNSNNMFGLERIAVDGNKIYVYFEKSHVHEGFCLIHDLSKVNEYTTEEWNEYERYHKPWNVHCKNTNGETMHQTESAFFENDEYAMLVSTFENEISDKYWQFSYNGPFEINNFSQPSLYYIMYGGDCMVDYTQSYDKSTKTWSEVSDELLL